MGFNRECQGCGHKGSCHSIYYRLGHAEGPSVLLKALLAFGIPLVVFIAGLMVAGTLFGGILTSNPGPTLLSLVVASMLTVLVVAGIWRFTQRPSHFDDQRDEVDR